MESGELIGNTQHYKPEGSSSIESLRADLARYDMLMKDPDGSVTKGLLIRKLDVFGRLEYKLTKENR